MWRMDKDHAKPREFPRLCDLLDPRRSWVTVVQQFLSGLLAGTLPVIKLIIRRVGCKSFAEMQMVHAADMHCVRKNVFRAAGINLIRHDETVKRWPWFNAVLVDTRRPDDERYAMGVEYCDACEDCLDQFHTIPLRMKTGQSKADLWTHGVLSCHSGSLPTS